MMSSLRDSTAMHHRSFAHFDKSVKRRWHAQCLPVNDEVQEVTIKVWAWATNHMHPATTLFLSSTFPSTTSTSTRTPHPSAGEAGCSYQRSMSLWLRRLATEDSQWPLLVHRVDHHHLAAYIVHSGHGA